MKGKLEEAKQMLCYAAAVNKTTIPLSLLDKVRDLWPGVGARGGGLHRGLFPPHPFRGDLCQRVSPAHCSRRIVTAKWNPAREKPEARLVLGGRGQGTS